MKQQINRLPIQRPICRLARQLTALQLLCYSQTYAQRRDVLGAELLRLANGLDELEVASAGTPLNGLLEQANRYSTALLLLLATNPCSLTPAELAPMLSPVIRLLTEAEHQAMEVKV